MQELKVFAKSAADVAATGFAKANLALQAARLEACAACAFYEPERDRCLACGCRVSLKAAFLGTQCPQHFWPEPAARAAGP
jgi:hypothetical protein